MSAYEAVLLVAGLAIFGAVVLPRFLAGRAMSFPPIYVVVGAVLFSFPVGVEIPDPVRHGDLAERLTEFVVIIALMGAGLKLDRPFDLRAWSNTWRLLAITMPLTILAAALLGWGVLGTLVPAVILLGAVIAPRIRGIGSFYYLAYALNEASFAERELLVAADKLWALVGFVVLLSIVVHGLSANVVMGRIDRLRDEGRVEAAAGGAD